MTDATPLLTRIRGATVTCQDLARSESWYGDWLGLKVRERGTIAEALARSWNAPAVAGAPYLLMSSDGSPDVLFRFIEAPAVPGYKAMTSWGWNSIEIIVDDVHAVEQTMRASPFTILDTPHPLQNYPSIVAMQVKGPSEEVLYLTMETGDRGHGPLPVPKAPIDRPFIAVVAGPDIDRHLDWYAKAFRMDRPKEVRSSRIGLIQTAQGMPADHAYPLSLMRMAAHGNSIEFDEYPAKFGARPRAAGGLPPGNSFWSFAVRDLGAIDLPFISAPAAQAGLAYGGGRSAMVEGPAGELIELIEEGG